MGTRRAARVRAKIPIRVGFLGSGMQFVAHLWDLSVFGLSVKTPRVIPIGSVFRLGIPVGNDFFRAACIVRSHIPDGFGVEFISMTPMDRELIARLYLQLVMAARAMEA